MFKRFLKMLSGSNTLYYPGCVTQYAIPELAVRYETLLRRAGVDFIVLPGETLCCGSPVKRAGYAADFDALKQKNLAVFNRFSVKKIITNCPGCYHTLKYDYGLDAYHVTQILSHRLRAKSDAPTKEMTYHDSCHLGRWSGIYDQPRQLLQDAGWEVLELPDNRERSLCCGAGGGVKSNYPELANAIARQWLEQVNNGVLCTACPLSYAHFKENAAGVEVLEFSQALEVEKERKR
jgi:Fe-S oxidoreductase